MKNRARPRLLCVDDEPAVLESMALHLGRHYEVVLAGGAAAALEVLARVPAIDVIISDMRMPGRSGAELMAEARLLAPATERIILTGQADLNSAIAAVNEGQIFRYLTKPCAPPQLREAVEAALQRRRARVEEQTELQRRARLAAQQTDPQSGLASRLRLLGMLEARAFEPDSAASELVAYYIDCDREGAAMRLWDSVAADALLRAIALRLQHFFADATLIARWGAEQFVAVVPAGQSGDEELHARGLDLQCALADPLGVGQEEVRIASSVGIARLHERSRWDELVATAALAAQQARRSGGMRVCLRRPGVLLELEVEREILQGLRLDLGQDRLQLHYQPVVDADQGRVRAFECLLRWRHAVLGEVSPGTFIPIAERSGDIVALGEWVLWRACHEGREVVRDGRLGLAVNVSPGQIVDPGFMPHLVECLAHSGLPADALTLELTETALASDPVRLREALECIRRTGVHLAVDDFGTGYSSLAHVGSMPIDVIKIDRAFVRDFHTGGSAIIRATLSLARELQCDVVVEGVESAEMLQKVRRVGAALIQGFWYARPMPAGEAVKWLANFEGSGGGDQTHPAVPASYGAADR
jgi:predicted signal transduction protein with EAL and GGDEF domain